MCIHDDGGEFWNAYKYLSVYVTCFFWGGMRTKFTPYNPSTHRCGKMIVATGAKDGGDASSTESQRLEVRYSRFI